VWVVVVRTNERTTMNAKSTVVMAVVMAAVVLTIGEQYSTISDWYSINTNMRSLGLVEYGVHLEL